MTNIYKWIYVLIGSTISLFSFALGAFAVIQVPEGEVTSLFRQASVVTIIVSCIVLYRFLLGYKKGHLVIFSYILIGFIINLVSYLGVERRMQSMLALLITILMALTAFFLAALLKKTKDQNYFERYFSDSTSFL